MYEKITAYLDCFSNTEAPEAEISAKIGSFVEDFSKSGLANPEALMIMGMRGWATRSALKADAPTMTAEEACACLSAFTEQESYCPGVILELVRQGIMAQILQRLKELDG